LDFVSQQCLEQLLVQKEQALGRTSRPTGSQRSRKERSRQERPP
jgi:hypothetical protein